jgi:hypothetical protein
MPKQPHPNDLRDLYIKLNPNGWCDEDLEKDSLGFVDPHTSQDFNSFRAGHQAGQEDSERLSAEGDALQRLLNERDEEVDRLRAVEAAAKEMLRIAGIANQGSNAYNRAITHLHQTLEAKS